jgi:gamma-resorcylate decarboxylase
VDDVGLRLASIEERVKHMDAAGVAISAVSLIMPDIEGIFDTAKAAEIASNVNDQMHRLYRRGAAH